MNVSNNIVNDEGMELYKTIVNIIQFILMRI